MSSPAQEGLLQLYSYVMLRLLKQCMCQIADFFHVRTASPAQEVPPATSFVILFKPSVSRVHHELLLILTLTVSVLSSQKFYHGVLGPWYTIPMSFMQSDVYGY